ncbi:MAG: phosphopentomutase [Oscillospiraceae bacterium]|jgi:phosphopentomutase|nr:phosphopentomutase [Oscillospiraceae bacterium]
MKKRLFLMVLDSFGIGAAPDAEVYGDAGSDTLYAISRSAAFRAPNLTDLGLFNIAGTKGGAGVSAPRASFARMAEKSVGKDTTVGHWEIAGLITEKPFPTYPGGFPRPLLDGLARAVGRDVLCGLPYSGTKVIADYGREHVRTGALIVYTSADSVLQIAAHEDVVGIESLYDICAKARAFMQGAHAVSRIIARPFAGDFPDYARTANRRDFALPPPGRTMLDSLCDNGLDVIGVGKISDIFAGRGVSRSYPTHSNAEGMEATLSRVGDDFSGLCFVNLVDFDMLFGHRNDVDGYAAAMAAFDDWLPAFLSALGPGDVLIITADHGCDPATPSTDHSREYTPMLIYGGRVKAGVNLGTRETMADIAATVLDFFGLPVETQGRSFWEKVKA